MSITRPNTPQQHKTKDRTLEKISQQKRNGYKKYIWLSIAIFLIPVFAFAWQLYGKAQALKQQQEKELATLNENNYNINAYKIYLEKYPQSEGCRRVKQRLKELENLSDDWDLIKNSQNENKFVDFKNKYKDPYYSKLCDNKIDSIDWNTAKLSNNPDSFQKYINRHPKGIFIEEAERCKNEASCNLFDLKDKEIIHTICNQMFTAISINDTTVLFSQLAPHIEFFGDINRPNHKQVCEKLNQIQNAHTFISFYIHNDMKSRKDITIGNQIQYISTFQVDQITTNASGAEKITPFETTIKMNKNFKIYSFTLRNI